MLRHDLIYFSDISSSTKFSYTIVLTISVLILCGYRWKYTWSEGDAAKYQNIGFLPSQRMLNNASYSIEYLNKPRVKHKICPMFICGACGMGNAIFQFASAFGIALHLNMKLVIAENDIFNKIFQIKDNAIEIHQNRHMCDTMEIVTEQYGCCTYDKTFRSLNSSRDFRLRDYLHSWKYFQGYESKIRKQLVFKKHLQHYAEQTILYCIHKHQFRSRSETVIVGVHVRRGDMVHKSHRGYNVASAEYFVNAILLFSSKFNKTILFIIATNDKNWTMQNIVLNKHLLGFKFEITGHRRPENDFVVLSNCDHVITSVGTFGWWAAWIANGVTTYYKWPVQPNTYVGNQYNKDFTDFFYPNWIGL